MQLPSESSLYSHNATSSRGKRSIEDLYNGIPKFDLDTGLYEYCHLAIIEPTSYEVVAHNF